MRADKRCSRPSLLLGAVGRGRSGAGPRRGPRGARPHGEECASRTGGDRVAGIPCDRRTSRRTAAALTTGSAGAGRAAGAAVRDRHGRLRAQVHGAGRRAGCRASWCSAGWRWWHRPRTCRAAALAELLGAGAGGRAARRGRLGRARRRPVAGRAGRGASRGATAGAGAGARGRPARRTSSISISASDWREDFTVRAEARLARRLRARPGSTSPALAGRNSWCAGSCSRPTGR